MAHVGALIPLARLGWAYQQGTLQVDPVGVITMRTGRAGLTLLLLSLACTPLITLTGWEAVGRLRREPGLYAAAYVGLHALTFLGLDYGFAWSLIGRAVWQQRYLLAGVIAGVVLGGPGPHFAPRLAAASGAGLELAAPPGVSGWDPGCLALPLAGQGLT
ncbi:MAG: hypothetical protein J7M16_02790 [Anaerolineae bacterium]|nr:hypothetical protein [Anaerolineae bacterium]